MRLTKICPMKLLAASVIAASLGALPACGGCLEVRVETQPPSSETAKAMEAAAKAFVDGIIQKDWSMAASSVSPAVRQGVSRTLKDPGNAFENEALAGIRKRLLSLKDDVEKDGNRILNLKNGSGREKLKMDENVLPLVRCSGGGQLGLNLQSGGSYGGNCEVGYELKIDENNTVSVSIILEVTFVADASGRWLLDSFALRGETIDSHYMRYMISADGIQMKAVELSFLEKQALRGVLALERALVSDAEGSK